MGYDPSGSIPINNFTSLPLYPKATFLKRMNKFSKDKITFINLAAGMVAT